MRVCSLRRVDSDWGVVNETGSRRKVEAVDVGPCPGDVQVALVVLDGVAEEGCADDSGTVSTTTKSTRTSRFVGITIKHILDAGFLVPGTPVVSTNSVWPANGQVNADGTITFDGTNYPTPSAAAAAVKGTGAVNGWEFWALDEVTGKVSLATLRGRFVDSKRLAP